MPKLGQNGISQIVVLILLVVGLGAGLYLVQHPAIFKPKAYSGQSDTASCEMHNITEVQIVSGKIQVVISAVKDSSDTLFLLIQQGNSAPVKRHGYRTDGPHYDAYINTKSQLRNGNAKIICRIDKPDGTIKFEKSKEVIVQN